MYREMPAACFGTGSRRQNDEVRERLPGHGRYAIAAERRDLANAFHPGNPFGCEAFWHAVRRALAQRLPPRAFRRLSWRERGFRDEQSWSGQRPECKTQ